MADNQTDESHRAVSSIRKLSDEGQWDTWKWQITLCLREQCLDTIVDGTRVCPVAPVASAAPSADYRQWQRDNARAARLIGTALDEEAASYVRKKIEAKEIWDTLVSVFEQSSLQRLYTLFDDFFEVTKDDATSVTKHASRLANLFDDILSELKKENADATLPFSLLHHRIFKTLGPEYQYYRSTWYRIPKTEKTTKLLIENLRSIESSLTSHESNQASSAFYTKSRKDTQKRSSNSSQSQSAASLNSSTRGTPSNTPTTKKKETRSCLYCKKVGHIIADCRKRAAAEQARKEADSKPAVFFTVGLAAKNNFVAADSWIADSGASHHMTANKQHFASYEKFAIPIKIDTAGEKSLYAYGAGYIKVDVYVDDRWSSASLTSVWYVPDIKHQLFSVRQAAEKGNVTLLDSDGCTVLCNNAVVATGNLVGNVYVMNMRVHAPKTSAEVNISTTEEILQGWHERLGHQDKRHVRDVLSRHGIIVKSTDTSCFCDGCVLGKSHRKPFRARPDRPQTVGEVINADVNGPMSEVSLNNFRYYVVFKDDYSRFVRIFFMKQKSEVAENLKTFLNECDTAGHKVKVFRSDGGREFDCEAVLSTLRERGIEFRPTCPDTPEQNGVAEQSNRHIVELARSMLSVSKLPKSCWAHACDTAAFLVNRTGKSSIPGKTPLELWNDKTFDRFDYLRIFGSECYVNVPKKFRSKFDDKAVLGHFVGYVNEKDGYKVWVPSKHRVVKSHNVDFRPEKLCTNSNQVELYLNHQDEQQSTDDRSVSEYSDECDDEIESELDQEVDDEFNNDQPSSQPNRSAREIRPPARLNDYEIDYQAHRSKNSALACLEEAVREELAPTNFHDAMKSRDSDKWLNAMQEEMNAFQETKTWKLVPLPKGKRTIDNRWVLRVKYKPDGSVDRYRARLVARGVFQRAGYDYDEIFAPVARYDSIRALLATAAVENLVLSQFDVKTAFLYGNIDTEIYMTQPEGFNDGSGRVCRILKSLYGLKQSPRRWNEKFDKFMKEKGFVQSQSDPCIYIRHRDSIKLLVAIYVDDGLVAGSNQEVVDSFMQTLEIEFKITIGSLDSFLGMRIEQRESGLFVSQKQYTEKILKRFDMEDSKPQKTPADNEQTDQTNIAKLDSSVQYRQAVGSLLYLACATRPDIAFAVSKVARSMADPNVSDWISVKRVFRYLRGTADFGLFYTSKNGELRTYSDADFAGDVKTRRSTNGFVSLIGGTAVSWTSQLQKSVALSTTEAEFVAASEGTRELMWLKRLLNEISDTKIKAPTLYVDNASAIKLAKNCEFHKRSKHIAVRYFFVRERYQNGDISVEFVPSENQLGDLFTKPLNGVKFATMRSNIGLCKL